MVVSGKQNPFHIDIAWEQHYLMQNYYESS